MERKMLVQRLQNRRSLLQNIVSFIGLFCLTCVYTMKNAPCGRWRERCWSNVFKIVGLMQNIVSLIRLFDKRDLWLEYVVDGEKDVGLIQNLNSICTRRKYACIHLFMYLCVCVCIYTGKCMYMDIYISLHLQSMCIYICICICMYIHVYSLENAPCGRLRESERERHICVMISLLQNIVAFIGLFGKRDL